MTEHPCGQSTLRAGQQTQQGVPGGRTWRPGSGHRDTSGSGAAERQVEQSLSSLPIVESVSPLHQPTLLPCTQPAQLLRGWLH